MKTKPSSMKSSSSSSSGSSPPKTNGHTTPASSVSNGPTSMSSTGPFIGQIHVKIIQARGLNVVSSKSLPYVVVQCDQNEFVSRDPTDETDKEVKGVAINLSRTSSSTALSALGAINSKASSKQGSARSSAQATPSSSFGSGKSHLQGALGARINAHNPVWKHEVSL